MAEIKSDNNIIRIMNCLQTILELEPELERLDLDSSLLGEFIYLKKFIEKIDRIELNENDVERIEKATANFLSELKIPFSRMGGAVVGSSLLH